MQNSLFCGFASNRMRQLWEAIDLTTLETGISSLISGVKKGLEQEITITHMINACMLSANAQQQAVMNMNANTHRSLSLYFCCTLVSIQGAVHKVHHARGKGGGPKRCDSL